MKKKFFSVAIVAAIALGAGWNVMQSENDMKLSDLALSNVEALANNEETDKPSCTNGCASIGWGFEQIVKCDCSYTGWVSSCNKWGC